MPRRRIEIEFDVADDNSYRVLPDLAEAGLAWAWLLRELNQLSDSDIQRLFHEGDRPAGPEGRWGLLILEPYLLICQLWLAKPMLWELGAGSGHLKVVRLYRRRGVEAAIEEMHLLEKEAERHWREEQAAHAGRERGKRRE
jgi:hypothetical protein